MKKSHQRGSAHIIIIIVLILALLGSLGYIFWQNFTSKVNDQGTHNTKSVTTPKKTQNMTQGSLGDAFNTKISFTYPSNWSLTRKQSGPNPVGNEDVSSDEVVISSPSGSVHVRYGIDNGGLGGYCDPESQGSIMSISFNDLKNMENTSFVQLVEAEKDGTFTGITSLMRTAGQYYRPISAIQPGDSICDIGFRQRLELNQGSFVGIVIFGDVASPENSPIHKQLKANDVQNHFKGEEYEQAKAVLLSTTQQ